MPFDIDKLMESFQKDMTPGSERMSSAPMNQIGANKPRFQYGGVFSSDVDKLREDRTLPGRLAARGKAKAENYLARDYMSMGEPSRVAEANAARTMDFLSHFPKKYRPPQTTNAAAPAASVSPAPKGEPQWAYTAAEPYVPPATKPAAQTDGPNFMDLMSEHGLGKTIDTTSKYRPGEFPDTTSKYFSPEDWERVNRQNQQDTTSKYSSPPSQQGQQDTTSKYRPEDLPDTTSKYAAPPTQSFKDSFDIDSRMNQWDAANHAQCAEDIETILKSYVETAQSKFARESGGKTSADHSTAADTGRPTPKEDPDIPKGTTTVAERFTMDSNGNMVLPNDSGEDYAARDPKVGKIKRVQSE